MTPAPPPPDSTRREAEATTQLDLVALYAQALHECAANIVEHANDIFVRVKIGERWENYPLSELRGTMAIAEAFRLLLCAEVPHRKLPVCAHCAAPVADTAAHVCDAAARKADA